MNRESFTDILMNSLKGRRLFIKMGATNGRLGIDSLSAYAVPRQLKFPKYIQT
jgi:hypothetical protein